LEKLEEKNAIIESADISDGGRGLLTASLQLDYGVSGQSFGGLALYLPKSFSHHRVDSGFAGHWIYRVMEIAGVTEWANLPGRTIRVRATFMGVKAIGHIVKDDWFDPEEDFAPYVEKAQ
jgi:hypothetical protein